jgi:hypothetical protein
MKGRRILVLFFVILVAVPLLSVAKPIPQTKTLPLDPGWINGPIWGRIDGYEFRGTSNESLMFYAINVHYFGIGHAFSQGLYPRHWVNKQIEAWYSFFHGLITDHFMFGRISGLPDQ